MKRQLLVAFITFWLFVPTYGDLPPKAKQDFETRFKKAKSETGKTFEIKELGTVLIVAKPGIPANFDQEYGSYPINLESPDHRPEPPVEKARELFEANWPRVNIKEGHLTNPDHGQLDTTLRPGDVLGLVDIDYDPDGIEFFLRSADERQSEPDASKNRRSGRVSVRLRFYIDPQVMESGDLAKIYAVIEEWLRPYKSLKEAEAAGKSIPIRIRKKP